MRRASRRALGGARRMRALRASRFAARSSFRWPLICWPSSLCLAWRCWMSFRTCSCEDAVASEQQDRMGVGRMRVWSVCEAWGTCVRGAVGLFAERACTRAQRLTRLATCGVLRAKRLVCGCASARTGSSAAPPSAAVLVAGGGLLVVVDDAPAAAGFAGAALDGCALEAVVALPPALLDPAAPAPCSRATSFSVDVAWLIVASSAVTPRPSFGFGAPPAESCCVAAATCCSRFAIRLPASGAFFGAIAPCGRRRPALSGGGW